MALDKGQDAVVVVFVKGTVIYAGRAADNSDLKRCRVSRCFCVCCRLVCAFGLTGILCCGFFCFGLSLGVLGCLFCCRILCRGLCVATAASKQGKGHNRRKDHC